MEVTARLFDGQPIRVVLPEIVARELYRDGWIEPDVTALLLEQLRPGMVFVDIGAQYGYFTLLASRIVGPGGTVVAFEPSRTPSRLLRTNVAHRANVVVEAAAVGAQSGSIELSDFGPTQSALNTTKDHARVPPAERARLRPARYQVPTVTLDRYTDQRRLRPDIVKIDAEGAEVDILHGMTRILRTVRPTVVLETGDYEGMASPPTTTSIDLLAREGYACFEYAHGLRLHRRRTTYGYGNLIFRPAG